MRDKTHTLFWIGLVAGLAAVMALYLLAGRGASAPVFVPGGDGTIGQNGPVGLRFIDEVDQAGVEMRLGIQPQVAGRWNWQGQTVWFDPQPAFEPGITYTLRLEPGGLTASGRELAGGSWSFQAREPWLAYLSPVGTGSEVWGVPADGAAAKQLTHSGGRVQDFSVTAGGAWILFSAANDEGGADIWRAGRDGTDQTRLVTCGSQWCDGAAAAPDSSRFAYSQRERARGLPRPYLYMLETGKSEALSADTLVRGEAFRWSPDGRRLAMHDGEAGAIRVIDFQTGQETLFETNVAGEVSWSPDGSKMLFLHEDRKNGFAHMVIFLADLEQQSIEPVFEEAGGDDAGLPQWSPAGDRLLLSRRVLPGSSSRQLYTIQPDGSGLSAVTSDLLYTAAAYQWSVDGKKVVYQRLRFGSSDHRPEVALWDRETGSVEVLATNAARPQWLP